jgi:hypothetical protein
MQTTFLMRALPGISPRARTRLTAEKEIPMNRQIPLFRSFTAIMLGAILSLPSLTLAADNQPTIVVVHTFEVNANAEGFIKMINEAIKTSREVDSGDGRDIYVLAGHVEPESASQFVVYTAYPSMDDYIENKTALENDPRMQAFSEKMSKAGFTMINQSINTLVSEY